MTKQEMGEIKEAVSEAAAANKPKPFSNIPGGPAGAVATLAIVIFFAKDYFADFKSDSAKLSTMSAQQMLIIQELGTIKDSVDDLENRTDKRYTSEDAGKDLGVLQGQINLNAAALEKRAIIFDEIDDRLDKLEINSRRP